jgi:iron complex outermembrane receptor protein
MRKIAFALSCGLGLGLGVTSGAFAQTANNKPADASTELQEVVVTGTLIRGTGPIGEPATAIDNATIVASGMTNTADLLSTQTALNSFNTLPIGGNQEFRSTGATVPGMRGLPGTAVLVMLDGHRLVGDSPLLTTADPSSIPAGAIDHIEIVQDGGSATYGSDAVAGVINIILKKNFEGFETSGSYTKANGYDAANFGQTFGKTWSGGSMIVSGTYENNSALLNSDRSYYTQDLRQFGGRDGLSASCAGPLNVLVNGSYYNSATGAKLPVTPVAGFSAANPVQSKYAPPVTQAVSCDPALNDQLVNPNRRFAFVGDVRQDVGDHVHLFADAKWTDDLAHQIYNPTNLVVNIGALNTTPGTLQQTGTLAIPTTNPYFYTPPGVTVAPGTVEQVFANSGIFGAAGNVVNDYRAQSGMFDFGASVDLSRTWQLTGDVDYGYSTSDALDRDSSGPNPNALYAAENGTTTATALDPFGGRTDPGVIQQIMNWPLLFKAVQRIYDVTAKADGSLFTLPGGDLKLALGGENRHELYSGEDPIGVPGEANFTQPNNQSATRQVNAVFGELAIPIIGPGNELPFVHRLAFSLAERYDHYSDFGKTTNPKYGFEWSPVESVNLRGSYGTSFHAPQLADVYAIDTRATAGNTSGSTIAPTNFPVAAGLATIGFAGGKPHLKPETAKTGSVGIDFKPTWLPGFKASATYFLIRYSNEVEIPPNNAAAINNPALAGQVYVFNQTSTTGCDSKGNPVAAGTGGPCYAPIPQATLAALLAGVRAINFTGTPSTYLVTDQRRTNLGSTDIDGWDFDFNYTHDAGAGTLMADLSGEYLLKFQTQTAPGLPFTDNLTSGVQYFQNDAGAQSIIPWHVRGTLGYQVGPLSTQAAVSYTGHYNYLYSPYSYVTNPNGTALTSAIQWVSPFVTVDWSGIWQFPDESGLKKGLRLQFNVYNILNAPPPVQYITGASGGFASESASPLGRTFRLSFDKRW